MTIGNKGISMLIGFLLIPLTLSFLGKDHFGLWLTITSLISWFFYLDIGLGNGLRNLYAISLAQGDDKKAKALVSTSYFFMVIFSILLLSLFFFFNHYINWTAVLNFNLEDEKVISALIQIVFYSFLIRFIFQLINSILLAEQKTGLSSVILPISNLLILITLYYISSVNTTKNHLIIIGLIYSIYPILILILFNLVLFGSTHQKIRPSVRFVKFRYLKEIFGLGFKFFFLQISTLAIFSVSNIILIHMLDATAVTIYNSAIQLFSYIITFFMVFVSPYWSAFTEAYFKNDINWLRKTIRALNLFWVITSISTLILLIFSRKIIHLWLGSDITPSIFLLVLTALFVILYTRMAIYNLFVNGIGEIKLQLKIAVIATILNIPLAVLLVRYIGMEGMILSIIICVIPYNILIPRQVKNIIQLHANKDTFR